MAASACFNSAGALASVATFSWPKFCSGSFTSAACCEGEAEICEPLPFVTGEDAVSTGDEAGAAAAGIWTPAAISGFSAAMLAIFSARSFSMCAAGNVMDWTFLSISDFEFAALAACRRESVSVALTTGLLSSSWRTRGRGALADSIFDPGRLAGLAGLTHNFC